MRVSAPSNGSFRDVYHYEMLRDSGRLDPFRRAIEKSINDGDVVLDAGTGVGILAYIAASKASKVYAIEMDPRLSKIARKSFERSPYRNKFELIEGDATKVELNEQVDLIICEMMDTGLISEYQVPVMNNLRRFLRADGRIIPHLAVTYATLVNERYDFYGVTFRICHYIRTGLPKPIPLSEKKELLEVHFSKDNPVEIEKEITFDMTSSNVVNSVRLDTKSFLCKDECIESAETLNQPMVFPLEEDKVVQKNEKVKIKISYKHGGGLDNFRASLLKP